MTSTLPQRLAPHPAATPPAGIQGRARAALVRLQLADAHEREHLRRYLAGFGWQVEAPGQAGQTTADLAAGSLQVMDWPPPDDALGQPFKPGTRTLCLSGAELGRRAAALEAGADDCLSRPYEVRELAARLAAAAPTRCAHPGSAARSRDRQTARGRRLAAGGRPRRRLHHRSGRSVTLTETELRLLRVYVSSSPAPAPCAGPRLTCSA